MVVEVRSPGDNTYDKSAFYLTRGVEEILVADLTSRELRLLVRDPKREYIEANASQVLQADVARIARDITWP